ncbi:hypothetical protein LSGJ_00300 [Ligilactobacillus salivarius GJ-24]|uniref:Uncharacterized protein n=1 Tax=Ligilactobacillus salivarius GJ-24 TaxID=1041521 RepID=F7QT02_9LACO|nr:hypothetical protein LSGJ_00300 [Ligilactobacillus salivarius GJ-24]
MQNTKSTRSANHKLKMYCEKSWMVGFFMYLDDPTE